MKEPVLIGIDAGTSVIKSVAFTTDGRQLAAAAIPNAYQTLADGGAEQDMARTWTDAARTLKQLTEVIPDLAERLVAISVTGQGDGIWLIDAKGDGHRRGQDKPPAPSAFQRPDTRNLRFLKSADARMRIVEHDFLFNRGNFGCRYSGSRFF